MPIDDSLRIVAELTGVRPTECIRLTGGQESTATRCRFADRDDLVVLVSPEWRTRAELDWAHSVCEYAARSVTEAVAPIAVSGQTTCAVGDGRYAELFPYIDGIPLDATNPAHQRDAARVLARIHCALRGWPGGPRPPHGPGIPLHKRLGAAGEQALEAAWDPPELHDPDLDAWWDAARTRDYVRTLTQGDYWSANILTVPDRVVGVIDWHDADLVPCVSDLAWAAAGCTGTGAGPGRAFFDFVDTYREFGGPMTTLRTSCCSSGYDGANPFAERLPSAARSITRMHGIRSTRSGGQD